MMMKKMKAFRCNMFISILLLGGSQIPLAEAANTAAGLSFHDLSHVVPMFLPTDGDGTRSDLNAPVNGSRAVAGSGGRLGVRSPKANLEIANGTIQWGYLWMEEHYSTHVDSTDHFITKNKSLLTVDKPDERGVDEFTVDELIGPVVYIDISARVAKELAKNGGKPSTDLAKTSFDNGTGNNVTVDDINAIADHLVDGAYIVMNVGWEQFYFGAPKKSNWAHPYNNMLNHPGITPAAVDRLVEIEQERGIRIAGLVADNIAVESGQSLRGPKMSTAEVKVPELEMYLHAVGLPRGWKLVENAANLGVLSQYPQGDCTLIIGAPKAVGASGVASRLIAMCPGQSGLNRTAAR